MCELKRSIQTIKMRVFSLNRVGSCIETQFRKISRLDQRQIVSLEFNLGEGGETLSRLSVETSLFVCFPQPFFLCVPLRPAGLPGL